MTTYDDEPVIKNAWPDWTPVAGGAHERRWTFEFEQPLDDAQIASAQLDAPNVKVTMQRREASKTILDLMATTDGNAWSDEIFFYAFYALFERLEQAFGRLKTIQGQPRDLWRPFRP